MIFTFLWTGIQFVAGLLNSFRGGLMPRFVIDVLHGVSQAGTGNGRYLKPADMLIRASQMATGLQQNIHFAHASCDFGVSHFSYMVASFQASQQAS